MGRSKAPLRRLLNVQGADIHIREACRKKGHLFRFVRYAEGFDVRHAPRCVKYWPTEAIGECARCGKFDVYEVKPPSGFHSRGGNCCT